MKVLIVGGSGFIGSRLATVLSERGHSVRIFDKSTPESPGVSFVAGDVRDRSRLVAAVEGMDSVFHLAAVHTDDVRASQLYYDVNVGGMRNLLAACTQARVTKIIFSSTVACYGLNNKNPDENAPLVPFNHYARSKLQAEELLLEWANTPGNTAIIVRPSVVFGERNRGNVYNLLRQIHRRCFAMVGGGENRKSMAYVGNFAEFLAWSHDNVAQTDIFNYADQPDLTMRELVETARALMGIRGRAVRIPYGLALCLGSTCDLLSRISARPLPFSRIRVVKFCADTTVNVSKAHAAGFAPKYPLRVALRETIRAEFPESSPSGHPDRVFFVYNTASYLLRFRSELMREFRDRGFDCHAALPPNSTPEEIDALSALGVKVHVLARFINQRITPVSDLLLISDYYRLYKELRPAIVFNFTIKPCIYSGLAAHLAGVPKIISTITGLGYAFTEPGLRGGVIAAMAGFAYRVALRRQTLVFFQNSEDRDYFRERNIVASEKCRLIDGSGIDTLLFKPVEQQPTAPVFLMVARLLKSKGIMEYLEASRITKAAVPEARCILVGPFDNNPSGIKPEVLKPYIDDGVIDYRGYLAEPLSVYREATIYVLPSYAEGRPRTIIEAMACGLAIITTEARGCREAIEPGVNGFLVPPRSAGALSEGMIRLAREPERVRRMGEASRRIAEERYDVRQITQTIWQTVHEGVRPCVAPPKAPVQRSL